MERPFQIAHVAPGGFPITVEVGGSDALVEAGDVVRPFGRRSFSDERTDGGADTTGQPEPDGPHDDLRLQGAFGSPWQGHAQAQRDERRNQEAQPGDHGHGG